MSFAHPSTQQMHVLSRHSEQGDIRGGHPHVSSNEECEVTSPVDRERALVERSGQGHAFGWHQSQNWKSDLLTLDTGLFPRPGALTLTGPDGRYRMIHTQETWICRLQCAGSVSGDSVPRDSYLVTAGKMSVIGEGTGIRLHL